MAKRDEHASREMVTQVREEVKRREKARRGTMVNRSKIWEINPFRQRNLVALPG